MLDGVIVQTVTREQYANASLSAIVVGADLIELRDHLPGFVPFPEPQVSFGEQIKFCGWPGSFWIRSCSSVTSS